MTKKALGYVHLEWTCPRCATKNPGPQKFCNGCGAPQPEGVQFDQPAQEELIKDAAEIAQAKAGPDVHCPYCNARNPGTAKFCGACGGDLAGAKAREAGRVVGAHRAGPAEAITCPSCGTANPATAQTCVNCGANLVPSKVEAPAMPPAAKAAGPRIGGLGVIIVVGVLLCVAAIVAVFLLTRPSQALTGEVQSVQWTRAIAVQALGYVEHEGWFDEIPQGAEVEECRMEYRQTQSEPAPNATEVCGTPYTVDTGGGFGEVVQDCAYEVYDEWCSFVQQEWTAVDTVTASGTDLSPYWPEVSLATGQRQGEGQEGYEVVLQTSQGSYDYTPSAAAEFSQFQIGSQWLLNVNAFGTLVSVEPAQ